MIIDIREQEEFFKGRIDKAINIPYNKLIFNPSKYLVKGEVYYIYCNSGIKSKKAVDILNNLGYKCVNVDGGYYNYLLRN